MPKLLIVRPESRARQDMETCRLAGWEAQLFSPMEIVPDSGELSKLNKRIEAADAVFWVSPSAVETAARYVDFSDGLKPHIAVGRAGAQALRDCGAAQVFSPPNGNDSEAVSALPLWQDLPQGAEVLIVRGMGGRNFLGEHLAERGFSVGYAEVYARQPLTVDWQHFHPETIDAAYIASSEAVRALFAQIPPQFSRFFKSLLYFTHHERIAKTLKAAGAQHIQVAATLEAALVQYLEKEHP